MKALSFSQSQAKALQDFKQGSPTVVTGQQIGFLGGPLYTIYKIASAIHVARELSAEGRNVVCIFWIEDNDHDSVEAGTAYIPSREFGLMKFQCRPDLDPASRVPVSGMRFDATIMDVIDSVLQFLPDNQHKSSVSSLLKTLYVPGKEWAEAFIELLNEFLGSDGLLFLRASVAAEHGLMQPIISREIENLLHG
jgi:uncharacterized protein YllA (UPF0747 family)